MKTKRIIALILVVILSFAALASCSEGTDVYTRGGDDTGSDEIDGHPKGDFSGEDFTFITFTSSVGTGASATEYYTGEWIDSDSIVGVATSDAVYKRNDKCQRKYNVNIVNQTRGQDFKDYSIIYNAGDFSFDVVYGWANRLSVGVTEGVFHDFRDLDDLGYIDMAASYWNPKVNDSLTIADRSFLATNDITMTSLSWTGCIFFNPQIVEDYNLENPHDLVESNGWTLDKFLEMVSSVHNDTDANGSFDREDQYGLIDMGTEGSLLNGCDVSLVDEDYTLAIGSEKVINLITKIRKVLDDSQHVFDMNDITNNADTGSDPWAYTRSYFSSGHSLFVGGTPELTREFRNMETGYGVVPLPKYDTNQKDYVSKIDSCAGIFALPNFEKRTDDVTTSSYERTGMILDYLADISSSDSSDSVLNAYYETTIKSQRQTIDKNKEMLDMVKGSSIYEWADVFWVGGSPEKSSSTISGVLGDMASSGSGLASKYKSAAKRLQKAIDDLYNAIDALS